jgi:NADPH:quinone reductase-like Zn-dependent oxidoreductase
MGGWLFWRQLAWLNGFKPLHTLHFGAASITLYSGLLALGANIIVAILVSAALRRFPRLDDNSVSGHCSELQSGQRVLVHGSAGAVGNLAIQLAHAAGAEVIATCRARDVAFVTKMGADEVIDIEATDFVLGTKPVNLVIDTVGGETQRRSFHVIAPGGRLVSVVSAPNEALAAEAHVQAHFFIVDVRRPALNELGALFTDGALQANIGDVLTLGEAPLAHEMLAGRPHRRGKIVLEIDSQL